MSLLAALLFNDPPTVFHGTHRQIIAREMRVKSAPRSKPVANDSPGAHELGRILRANIENLLAEGGRWNTNQIVAEFKARNISGSITSIRRHLNNMTDIGAAQRSVCDETKIVDYWQTGKTPPKRVIYKSGKPLKTKPAKRKVGSGNGMLAIMAKNRKLIIAAVASGCETHEYIVLETGLSRSCVQVQAGKLATLGDLVMVKTDRVCRYYLPNIYVTGLAPEKDNK